MRVDRGDRQNKTINKTINKNINKIRNKIGRISAMMLVSAFLLTGCGSSEETESSSAVPSVSTDASSEELPAVTLTVKDTPAMQDANKVSLAKDGMVKNPLTGLWIDESYENMRPISIQISNVLPAIPQIGIARADIVYEMLVEGGITRLNAIITEYQGIEKLGPMRSARHYYDRKALEYDAIFFCWGTSIYAQADIDGGLANLEAVDLNWEPGGFRSDDRYAPHNAYTNSDGINKRIETKGFSKEHRSGLYQRMYKFNDEFTPINGNPADKVITKYHNNRQPWFEYNEEDQLYYRFQYGEEQIDDETGEQLAYTNVLIQFAKHTPMPDLPELWDIDWTGEGDGYYCTGGKVIPVTWKYTNGVTRWYTSDGQELSMNPGKTWITVFQNSNRDGIVFESAKKEEDSSETDASSDGSSDDDSDQDSDE